ncbi:TetR family transcriptional regulator [Streptomyces sp. NPDC052052]|uniref:TetR/AcrR family transcriptional regulator n=1 Tax=Streptomyces sp. NPDC052052 TaxID=3154756 RepID=UPI003424F6A1
MSEAMEQATGRKNPGGRRAGKSGTRQAILAAARELFAEHGYDGASMRAIAAKAGVDTGLIRHFYGDKNGLITATLADRTSAPEQLAAALQGDPATVGERLAETYFDLWESPDSGPVVAAIFRSAVTSPKAMDLLRTFLGTAMQERVLSGTSSGGTDDAQRVQGVALALSHLLGVAIARHVVKAPPLAEMPSAELVRAVAPAVQRYLTGAHR